MNQGERAMKDIEESVRKFITTNFVLGARGSGLGRDQSLIEAGVIDSTGVLELTAFLEQEFGIRVEDLELIPDNLDSVAKIVNYVTRKTAAGSAS